LIIGSLSGCRSNENTINKKFTPIIEFGEISSVMLAYAARQNFIIPSFSEESETPTDSKIYFPDGLVFYFIVMCNTDRNTLTIHKEHNFKIDGHDYDTMENIKGNKLLDDGSTEYIDINPSIYIYDSKNFSEYEPELASFFLERDYIFENNDNAATKDMYVIKVIICGEKLPKKGLIQYNFSVGFDYELEEFDIQFDLANVR
jgi:hypothetical protein